MTTSEERDPFEEIRNMRKELESCRRERDSARALLALARGLFDEAVYLLEPSEGGGIEDQEKACDRPDLVDRIRALAANYGEARAPEDSHLQKAPVHGPENLSQGQASNEQPHLLRAALASARGAALEEAAIVADLAVTGTTIGPLFEAGWNEAKAFIADRIRALAARAAG